MAQSRSNEQRQVATMSDDALLQQYLNLFGI